MGKKKINQDNNLKDSINHKSKSVKLEKNKEIPTFSYKGAIVVMGFAMLGSFIFPLLLGWLISTKFAIVLGNTFITSFGIAFSRYKIETKRGFVKGFYTIWALFGFSFFVLTAVWLYWGVYI